MINIYKCYNCYCVFNSKDKICPKCKRSGPFEEIQINSKIEKKHARKKASMIEGQQRIA